MRQNQVKSDTLKLEREQRLKILKVSDLLLIALKLGFDKKQIVRLFEKLFSVANLPQCCTELAHLRKLDYVFDMDQLKPANTDKNLVIQAFLVAID